jgi:hypothetical protein
MKTSLWGCLMVLSVLPALADGGSMTGKWRVVGDVAGNRSDSVCTLTQEGTKLTGSCTVEDSPTDITGAVTDKEIR